MKKGLLAAVVLLVLMVAGLAGAQSLLRYDSAGDEVTALQERLTELGYYTFRITGVFQENTQRAVKDFQYQNGLKVDGVVGQDTWQALFGGQDPVPVGATPRPSPTPAPAPYFIGVDVTNQVTTVYALDAYGGYSTIYKQMICSTGTEQDPTPLKTYTLNGATSRWCYFPKWGSHGQYWTRMDSAIAFHSVIYTEANEMALSVKSYTSLGQRASHGCIRLMLEDAKWIYENCGKGVEVVVYEGEPDEELTKSLAVPPLNRSVMLPEATPSPTESPQYSPDAPPPQPFRTLRYGAEGEDVYWLQCRLAELGYYQGSITGGYYGGTREAVRAYQRDQGLSVDGNAGKNTLGRLYAGAPGAGAEATTGTGAGVSPAPEATTPFYSVPEPEPTVPPRDRPYATTMTP